MVKSYFHVSRYILRSSQPRPFVEAHDRISRNHAKATQAITLVSINDSCSVNIIRSSSAGLVIYVLWIVIESSDDDRQRRNGSRHLGLPARGGWSSNGRIILRHGEWKRHGEPAHEVTHVLLLDSSCIIVTTYPAVPGIVTTRNIVGKPGRSARYPLDEPTSERTSRV